MKTGELKMKNVEKIKQLSNWDMAVLLYDISNHATMFTVCERECAKCEFSDDYCISEIAEWLISESEE